MNKPGTPTRLCSLTQSQLISYLGGEGKYPLRSKKYLAYIRTKPCVYCGLSPAEPHHLHVFNEKHTRRWADICNTVPLCRSCHNEIHKNPALESKDNYKRKAVKLYVEWGKDND